MSQFYLTAYNGTFLGPIAKGLGWIMDKIYVFFLNQFGIESIPLTIIVFTVFIYMCLFPLTYKQQQFSVLSRKMQPELKAIQEKYKNKKDQNSVMAQQEETQAIYDKYGISPTGSCVQLIIQMPILFALYRVFYNVPAYITNVKNIFTDLVNGIMSTKGYADIMQQIFTENNIKNVTVDFTTTDKTAMSNYIIDVLYKLPANSWATLHDYFPQLSDSITKVSDKLLEINYIFMLNISDTPLNLIKSGWSSDTKQWGLMICALLIPVVSYLTQVVNMKLAQGNTQVSADDQMAQQMQMMNKFMPLMSLVICFTVPVGLGFYWIINAVVRFIQQFFLNKHFEKINLDDIIEKNKEKAAKKAEKRGVRRAQIYDAATMSTKSNSMASKARVSTDKQESLDKADALRKTAASGSMASKANLVKEFNERNNKN